MNDRHDDEDQIPEDIVPQALFALGWFTLKVMIWILIFLAIADWVGKK